MIQRIQTVYLFLAVLLVAALFFFPFAEIAGKDDAIFRFDAKGIFPLGIPDAKSVYGSLPIVFLLSFVFLLLLVTVFQYKNRVRQMRFSTLSILLLIGLFMIIFYYTWKSAQVIGGTYSLTLFSVFPIVAAVLVYLAIRGIAKDELLVRSIDRIR